MWDCKSKADDKLFLSNVFWALSRYKMGNKFLSGYFSCGPCASPGCPLMATLT